MRLSSYPTYKLGEVAEILDSFRKPINSTERTKRIQGKEEKELYPYYGATGQVGLIDEYLTDGEYVLVGEDGAPFLEPFKNKSYIIQGKTWVNNHAHILSGKENVSCNKYLCHFLNSFDYRGYVNGTTRLKLTQGNLVEIPIPLPPLPTQRAIVTRIESLFAELDKGVEKLKTAQQQLKVYRQAVLNDCLTKGSEKWKKVKLGEICSVLGDGLHGTPKFVENGDFYFINGNNLNGVIVIKQDTKTTNLEEFEKYKKNLNERTILISINGTLGNIAYYNGEPVVLGKSACYFNLLDGIEKDYVKYCLLSERFRSYAFKNATGSTIKNVPLKAMRMYSLPLPPLADQQSIVNEIESRLSQATASETYIENALQQAEALRQSILKKAFSGELI